MNNASNNANQGPQLTGLISDAVRVDARLGTVSGFFLVVLGILAIAKWLPELPAYRPAHDTD